MYDFNTMKGININMNNKNKMFALIFSLVMFLFLVKGFSD